MCGIGGFSLSKDSRINPKQLANALLTQLEARGGMASGFAYQDENRAGYFKAAVNGASLSLKKLPKDMKNVILHTRLATHGSTSDNRNNHPVISPGNNIALVHNGVIFNHEAVRLQLSSFIDFDVDTAVIPALIEEDDTLKRLTELDGDAAIAWFDMRKPGTLNLARLEYSPMVMCQTEDGSLIFASTESMLWNVLIQLNLEPNFMETVSEYTHFQVRNGVISLWEELDKPTHTYSYGTKGYYRHQTAGAKGSLWDDDKWDLSDDEWDDYMETKDWDEGFKPAENSNDYSLLNNNYFYIKTRDKLSYKLDNEFTYYNADEYDLFKNDIWYLKATKDENEIIDYGRLDFDTGEFFSYKDKPELEKAEVSKLGLTM
jgi:asparagine synthetase B (glutamine-hydrolysing)